MAGRHVNRVDYEYFEHTADVGIAARGATLPAAFANACHALTGLMVASPDARPLCFHDVELQAEDLADLLVQWLNEVLFLFDGEGFIAGGFAFSRLQPSGLRARLWGERFDPARHRPRAGVKAATYHQVRVERDEGGYELRVIVDV